MEMDYIIISDDGYWNNDLGWVELEQDATMFENTNYDLPIGDSVKWVVV